MGSTAPVESKVRLATAVSLLAALVLAILNAAVADSSILGGLPAWLQFIVIAAAPTLATFLAGYTAPHSPR